MERQQPGREGKVEIASQEIHRHAKGKKDGERWGARVFQNSIQLAQTTAGANSDHRMLANCYKIGTMTSVKAVGKI
jgi:hypothetical protein